METLKTENKAKVETLRSVSAESKPWEATFMWNRYLVEEFYELTNCKLWILPFIHGYVS